MNTLLGTNIFHIPSQRTFEDHFPFPKVGYVSSLVGNYILQVPYIWLHIKHEFSSQTIKSQIDIMSHHFQLFHIFVLCSKSHVKSVFMHQRYDANKKSLPSWWKALEKTQSKDSWSLWELFKYEVCKKRHYTPEIQHRYQKWWVFICICFQAWLFWVSMLVFGDVREKRSPPKKTGRFPFRSMIHRFIDGVVWLLTQLPGF